MVKVAISQKGRINGCLGSLDPSRVVRHGRRIPMTARAVRRDSAQCACSAAAVRSTTPPRFLPFRRAVVSEGGNCSRGKPRARINKLHYPSPQKRLVDCAGTNQHRRRRRRRYSQRAFMAARPSQLRFGFPFFRNNTSVCRDRVSNEISVRRRVRVTFFIRVEKRDGERFGERKRSVFFSFFTTIYVHRKQTAGTRYLSFAQKKKNGIGCGLRIVNNNGP